MSRSKLSDNSTAVTLFPFLAVLLCTMGSLLLILVVTAKVAREKAALQKRQQSQDQQARLAKDDVDVSQHLQAAQIRLAQLDDFRGRAEKALRDDQLRLRHIEDHMRRLQKHLESLQMAAAELNALEQEHYDDRMQAQREVQRLQDLIDETRKDISELEAEQEKASSNYAIVPYEGPNGTRRRPLYVECRKNRVILQPEGVELTPEDFRPPLGAGNALASALRAARDYLVRKHPEMGGSPDKEPYPLILVRPDGINAYYRVRAAIESWDADFGYELIDEDWKLHYPDVDLTLADTEHRAIQQARMRQKMLAAAAPVAYGGSSAGANYNSFDMPAGRGASVRGGAGFGAGYSESGSNSDNPYDDGLTPATAPGADSGFDATDSEESWETSASPAEMPSSGGGGRGFGDLEAGTSNDQGGESDATNTAQRDEVLNSGSNSSHETEPGYKPIDSSAQHGVAGRSSESESGHQSNRTASGDMQPADPGDSASAPNGVAAAAGAGSSPTPGQGSSQQAGQSSASFSTNVSLNSLAEARGENWAFGAKGGTGSPIRRTVQVVVRHDRVLILPEQVDSLDAAAVESQSREVLLRSDTAKSVESFVVTLRQHVKDWGIAGSGLYWRPVVSLHVAPDGQKRASELQSLLNRSGIEFSKVEGARR